MLGEEHHFGIAVSDLEASVAFYRDVLGMSETMRLETDPESFGELLGVDRATAEIAFLEGGGMRLELESHAEAETTVAEETTPNDVGVPHICLAVDDIQAVYEEHAETVDFVSPPGTATDSGAEIVYLRDPDRNLIELIELPPADER